MLSPNPTPGFKSIMIENRTLTGTASFTGTSVFQEQLALILTNLTAAFHTPNNQMLLHEAEWFGYHCGNFNSPLGRCLWQVMWKEGPSEAPRLTAGTTNVLHICLISKYCCCVVYGSRYGGETQVVSQTYDRLAVVNYWMTAVLCSIKSPKSFTSSGTSASSCSTKASLMLWQSVWERAKNGQVSVGILHLGPSVNTVPMLSICWAVR